MTTSKSISVCKEISQKPLASSKTPNKDLKDMDVLCTFKIKIQSQNLGHGCIKAPNEDLKDMYGLGEVMVSIGVVSTTDKLN